ncbi:hypothetical protein [Catenulispora pinisilvae]|uniref:hypothetical protein n=1 Tax=Catenulispora pinisilvae TaxID=2705253 RepID=UPI00189206FA|nr:hypothetical protein [Catenulispora pinisilvae]
MPLRAVRAGDFGDLVEIVVFQGGRGPVGIDDEADNPDGYYPDVVASGSLAVALQAAAAESGPLCPERPAGLVDVADIDR